MDDMIGDFSINRRAFLAAAAGGAALPLLAAEGAQGTSDGVLVIGDGKSRRTEFGLRVTGVYDVYIKFGGGDDAPIDSRWIIRHAAGECGRAFDQRAFAGWHFFGTYPLAEDSKITMTEPCARGALAVKLIPTRRRTLSLKASATAAVVELNVGDSLDFELLNGERRRIELVGAEAKVVDRRLCGIRKYEFSMTLEIDGRPHRLGYQVPSDEFIGKPFVVNGMNIWPDAVADVFKDAGGFMVEKDFHHGGQTCRPNRRACFVIQDASGRVCPDRVHWWYPERSWPIASVGCYHGGDTWMGTWYQVRELPPSPRGDEAHGGLDINMPRSTPLRTPFAVDDQYYFDRVSKGKNNNRWRGVRDWSDGTRWWIQSHHIDTVLDRIPDHVPLAADVEYCLSGGQWAWEFHHTHFNLRVFRKVVAPDGEAAMEDCWINPAIVFWQAQQDFPLPAAKTAVRGTERLSGFVLRPRDEKGVTLDSAVRGPTEMVRYDFAKTYNVEIVFGGETPLNEVKYEEYGIAGRCAAAAGGCFCLRFDRKYRSVRTENGLLVFTFDLPDGGVMRTLLGVGEDDVAARKAAVGNGDWSLERMKQ